MVSVPVRDEVFYALMTYIDREDPKGDDIPCHFHRGVAVRRVRRERLPSVLTISAGKRAALWCPRQESNLRHAV
jgi:hypothetical protein